ncbi:MAG: hypothetical protein JNL17_11680 [Cyclobacteriaceae bacterium]|nr:hypothetical protein [Cyclobacteriaceae bacterium]
MNKIFTLLFVTISSASICHGQIGIAYHQSNLPFVGINYEFKDRLRIEPRVGVDSFLDELSVELIATYDIVNKAHVEIYAGLGARSGDYSGPLLPIGANFFPFESKNFGFHLEVAPIFSESEILRGSWGIRYRFLKRQE